MTLSEIYADFNFLQRLSSELHSIRFEIKYRKGNYKNGNRLASLLENNFLEPLACMQEFVHIINKTSKLSKKERDILTGIIKPIILEFEKK